MAVIGLEVGLDLFTKVGGWGLGLGLKVLTDWGLGLGLTFLTGWGLGLGLTLLTG